MLKLDLHSSQVNGGRIVLGAITDTLVHVSVLGPTIIASAISRALLYVTRPAREIGSIASRPGRMLQKECTWTDGRREGFNDFMGKFSQEASVVLCSPRLQGFVLILAFGAPSWRRRNRPCDDNEWGKINTIRLTRHFRSRPLRNNFLCRGAFRFGDV